MKNTIQQLIHKSYISNDLQAKLEDSEIILISEKNDEFRHITEPYFPEHTLDFYQYLKKEMNSVKVEIAVEDSQYKELALHDDTITLASFIVLDTLWPIVVNLISTYLYDRLKSSSSKEPMARFKYKIKNDQGIILEECEYDGTVKGIKELARLKNGKSNSK